MLRCAAISGIKCLEDKATALLQREMRVPTLATYLYAVPTASGSGVRRTSGPVTRV